jgi:hypothetical protein
MGGEDPWNANARPCPAEHLLSSPASQVSFSFQNFGVEQAGMPIGEEAAKIGMRKQKFPHADRFPGGGYVSEASIVSVNPIGRESVRKVSHSVSKPRSDQNAIYRSTHFGRQRH